MTRRSKLNKPKGYSNHHKVPKSLGGNNHKDNIDRLSISKHRSLHTLFENADTIGKIEIILEMDKQVIQGDFHYDIKQVLNLYKGLIYHSHVLKKN